MLAKARADQKDYIIHRIKELHTYEAPCIIFLDINDENQEFLKWIKNTHN